MEQQITNHIDAALWCAVFILVFGYFLFEDKVNFINEVPNGSKVTLTTFLAVFSNIILNSVFGQRLMLITYGTVVLREFEFVFIHISLAEN